MLGQKVRQGGVVAAVGLGVALCKAGVVKRVVAVGQKVVVEQEPP